MINNSRFEQANEFCSLLKEEVLKSELNNLLEGYMLTDMNLQKGEFKCSFLDENKNRLVLFLCPNEIYLYEYKENYSKHVKFEENNVITELEIERREGGVLCIERIKHFAVSLRSLGKLSLVDLSESRSVFTNETIKKMLEKEDKDEITLFDINLAVKTKYLEIQDISDLYNHFETHMQHNLKWDGVRYITEDIYPTKTYLNGGDFSAIYEVNEGADKLYRVHDLYRGIINSRNERDVIKMSKGFLCKTAFDLKTFAGITDKENSLIGFSNIKESDNHINYIKELFEREFKYTGEITNDRESILKIITLDPSLKAKKKVYEIDYPTRY